MTADPRDVIVRQAEAADGVRLAFNVWLAARGTDDEEWRLRELRREISAASFRAEAARQFLATGQTDWIAPQRGGRS